MSNDDPFFGSGDGDRTVLKPTPGGRRSTPSPGPATPAPGPGPQAPAPQTPSGPVSLSVTGLNPLVTAAGSLLSVVTQVRNTATYPDAANLFNHVAQEMRNFETTARSKGETPETVLAARYALCTVLDETVLSTPWGSESSWANQTLLAAFHKEGWGGEKFFQIMDRLLQEPARNLHLLELLYICLALGFQGKFRVMQGGRAQLEQVQDNLFQTIRMQRGDFDRDLSPKWLGVQDHRSPLAKYVPLWVVGVVAAGLLMLAFVGFIFSLNTKSDPVLADLATLGRNIQPLESRRSVAGPPPVSLRPFLQQEIADGEVALDESAGEATITIRGDGLFASGTAQVNTAQLDLLGRIGRALNQVPGQVVVSGHTDGAPIRTLRFPSNWHLSKERAESVARILAEHTSGDRLISDARADSEQLVSEEGLQGQALRDARRSNRRVEITLLAGAGRE